MTAGGARPLEGIRVTDFFWLIAGPAASRVLSDFGAEVIKVETRHRMDTIREAGVWPPEPSPSSPNSVFNDTNTGKRSVTLNLNDPRGIELAKQLVRKSDIVTNNFTGVRMDQWGLGYDELVKVKPDIIMLSMPVMGTTGPYRHYGSVGNGVIAYAGLDTNMGFPGRPPAGIAPLYSDFATPYAAVAALMAALHHRARTGEGQFIDLAQFQASVGLLGTGVLEYTSSGTVPSPPGNRSADGCPHGAFPCAGEDRWCVIAVASDDEWRRLCEAIDRPELASDARFATHAERKRHEDALDELLAQWTGQRDPWEVTRLLQERGVMAGVVQNVEDVVDRDPHLSRYHFQQVPDADGTVTYTTHGQPARLDGRAARLERAPMLGEHNEYVFKQLLGVSDEQYAQLLIDEVIH